MEEKKTPPPICKDNEVEWLINVNGGAVGPLKESELLAHGLREDTLVYSKYLGGWEYARNIPVLSYLLTGVGVHDTHIGNEYPAIPTAIVTEEDNDDSVEVGNPYVTPCIGLIGIIGYVLFILKKSSASYSDYSEMAYAFKYGSSYRSHMLTDKILGILILISPVVIAVILGFYNAWSASHSTGYDNDSAQKKSGAATAWGFASIIMLAYFFFLAK